MSASGVVRCDFYVVGVGVAQPSIDIDIGGLVDLSIHLHGFHVVRCTSAVEVSAAGRVPTNVKVAVCIDQRDVDVVRNTGNHVDFKVIHIAGAVYGQTRA